MTWSPTWCRSASVQTSKRRKITQTAIGKPNKYLDLRSRSWTHESNHLTLLRRVTMRARLAHMTKPPWSTGQSRSVKTNQLGDVMKDGDMGTNSAALFWFRSGLDEQKMCHVQLHVPTLKDYSEDPFPSHFRTMRRVNGLSRCRRPGPASLLRLSC